MRKGLVKGDPVGVQSVGLMCDVGDKSGDDGKDRKKVHPKGYPSVIARPLSTYDWFVGQSRFLHHPPAPFASPVFPEPEEGGGSTNAVLLNNPSSPVGSSGGKNLCLLSTRSSPSPCRE